MTAISFAKALRFENWPMVAEFVQLNEAVWVSTEDQAKALQSAIEAHDNRRTTRVKVSGEFNDQWKVIRIR